MTLAVIQQFENGYKALTTAIAGALPSTSFAKGWAALMSLKDSIATAADSALVNDAPALEAAVMPIVTATIGQLAALMPEPALSAFFTSAALNLVQDLFETKFPETASQTTIAIAAAAASPGVASAAPLPPSAVTAKPATKATGT